MSTPSPTLSFTFDYYRFNGRGNRPTMVPAIAQADFMRSRNSVDAELVELAEQRVAQWAQTQGISITPKKPHPSSQEGRYWLEFRVGGLTL